MSVCQRCPGRVFQSAAALIQHQLAKHPLELPTPSAGPQTGTLPLQLTSATQTARLRDAQRIWNGLRKQEPVHVIDGAVLQPSTAPVSATTPFDLVCSYNWLASGGFHVPGHAPLWQDLALPVTVPKDPKKTSLNPRRRRRRPSWTTTTYPFEQVLSATAQMRPNFTFGAVDVVVTRNSLRKLLDFCSGKAAQPSFRIGLSLVRDTTLFIEQYDARAMPFQDSGWGHGFERTFTRFPAGLEGSTSHDRFLRYKLGEMDCVVGFEVDACYYEPKRDEGDNNNNAVDALDMQGQAIDHPPSGYHPTRNKPTTGIVSPMQQSTAAELKSKSKRPGGGIGSFLPQLWFGRTPWLIVGRHAEGTFTETTVVEASAQFVRWETDHQDGLRKLVAVLGELRDAVRRNGGRGCAAVCEKGVGGRRRIGVYDLLREGVGVPEEVIRRFWE
ncbi:geranylgeranyl pyrophosphate synthetase [Coniochaeta sp. 2T2.1]|nr:geranylgeranyl pyrophosphate synthetase [Coniochaeta sp. 2T2.1]